MEIHVHESNRIFAAKIQILTDLNKRHIINQLQANLIELIGRFPYENGNFMDEDTMLRSLPGRKICLRTLRNNLKYLYFIGVIEWGYTKDKKETIRLKEPTDDPKETMVAFRKRTKVYTYQKKCKKKKQVDGGKKEAIFKLPEVIDLEDFSMDSNDEKELPKDTFDAIFDENKPEFFSQNEENFSPSISGKKFPESGKIFPPLTNKEELRSKGVVDLSDLDFKEKNHPIVPPLAVSKPVLEPQVSKPVSNIRKSEDEKVLNENSQEEKNELGNQGQESLPDAPQIKNKGNSEVKTAEPLVGPKRKIKARKTSQELLSEATNEYLSGHITNPIGKVNTRGRKLQPSRARPVGETGAVTVAQLWAAYLEIFENTFGDKSILEGLMSPTREYMTAFFGNMKQKFLDYTGKTVDNRILYDYLVWYHDPKRVVEYCKPGKGYIHPLQLMGGITIKKFADQHVGVKTNELISEGVIQARKLTQFLTEAFEAIRDKHKDNFGMVDCLTTYGFIVVGEYLHDYDGWDGNRCKERMIEVLADFIVHSKNKEKAKEFVARAWERTKINKAIESTIWTNWEEACKNFVDLAIEKAERSNEDERKTAGQDNLPSIGNGQGT